MKRAEMMAWGALVLLVAVATICLIGGVMYRATFLWAGMIGALSQAAVVGLAAWGLMLGRQAEEMGDLSTAANTTEMVGMSFGEEISAEKKGSATRTLETGFQRVLAGLTGAVLLGMSALISYLIWSVFAWAKANPDKRFPVAGSFDKPWDVDRLGLVMGVAAAALYIAAYFLTRPGKSASAEGEAVESTFGLGALGYLGLGIAAVAAFAEKAYISEAAAGLIAGLLALEGIELLVNSVKSYSGVEELDQEAVDLQALPLVPMLSSYWLEGVKGLAAQSIGMGREEGERGVVARMMPRALAALLVIAIGASCFRVVPAGRIGILERLGRPIGNFDERGRALPVQYAPGLHVSMPWPIDTMVLIPTTELQYTDVGKELHKTNAGGELDFQFWTVGEEVPDIKAEKEDEFATGDVSVNDKGVMQASPQLLETYVGVWWKVKDPVAFYNDLSHADFYEKSQGSTTALPIYAALVQQATGYAVTREFAQHSLDEILVTQRQQVSDAIRKTLQDKLNAAQSGIEVVDLTIKDLHPPFGRGIEPDPAAPDKVRRGPANAFEHVVDALERAQVTVNDAETDRIGTVVRAQGQAAAIISDAHADVATKVGQAQGEAARMTEMMSQIAKSPNAKDLTRLAEMNTLNAALTDAMSGPQKVIEDPRIGVWVWQKGQDGPNVLPRGGQGGPGQ